MAPTDQLKPLLLPILNSYPGAWVLTDMQSRVIAMNDRMARWFHAPTQPPMQNAETLSPYPGLSKSIRQKVVEHGFYDGEWRYTDGDHSSRSLRVVCWLVRVDGRPVGIVSFLRELLGYGCDRLMPADEVATMLRVSTRTLRRLSKDQELPVIRVGRELRYRPQDIATWLESKRV